MPARFRREHSRHAERDSWYDPHVDIAQLQQKLAARGFKVDDAFLHPCAACGARAVARYALRGKLAGRQIELCTACGDARSWRQSGGNEDRVQDATFDLERFLA
jgi:hypothetical protein